MYTILEVFAEYLKKKSNWWMKPEILMLIQKYKLTNAKQNPWTTEFGGF